SEYGREVAAGEPGALAHADVGELAVVVHRGRDQPSGALTPVRHAVVEVVRTPALQPGIKFVCLLYRRLGSGEGGISGIGEADAVLHPGGLGLFQRPPVGGHHLQFQHVSVGRGPDQQVRVDVDVPGFEVEHVIATVQVPAGAEAGAVIEDFLVRTELDL